MFSISTLQALSTRRRFYSSRRFLLRLCHHHSSDVKIENPIHLLALDGVVLILPPSIFRLHSQSPIWCYVGSWSPHPNWKPCCARFRDLYICQMSGSGLKLNAENFPLIIIKKRRCIKDNLETCSQCTMFFWKGTNSLDHILSIHYSSCV